MSSKPKIISTADFDAALDHILYRGMTEGVPLMSKGEPVLDKKGKPIMVVPDHQFLGVAERRAKAKRAHATTAPDPNSPLDPEAREMMEELTTRARAQGGDLPPVVDEDAENERE